MAPQQWKVKLSIVNNWSQRTKSPNIDPHVARAPRLRPSKAYLRVIRVQFGVKWRDSALVNQAGSKLTTTIWNEQGGQHHHLELTWKSGPSGPRKRPELTGL